MENFFRHVISIQHWYTLGEIVDQYQYTSNGCTYPSPNQKHSTDNKLGLMLGYGRGRCAVAKILTLIRYCPPASRYIATIFILVLSEYAPRHGRTCSKSDFTESSEAQYSLFSKTSLPASDYGGTCHTVHTRRRDPQHQCIGKVRLISAVNKAL